MELIQRDTVFFLSQQKLLSYRELTFVVHSIEVDSN